MAKKETIVIATAEKPKDLATTYTKVKELAKGYGFTAVANLKEDVVGKAMTDHKKKAEFVVELEVSNDKATVDLVCDVGKGKMKSVIGRKEIKKVEDYVHAEKLAKNQNLNEVFK